MHIAKLLFPKTFYKFTHPSNGSECHFVVLLLALILFKFGFNLSVFLSPRSAPYTRRHEGVCAPSALGFMLCKALISPFVRDAEEHDAEGHGR